MNKSVKYLLMTAGFIVLIGAAVLLYRVLSEEYKPQDLQTGSSQDSGESASSAQTVKAPDFRVTNQKGEAVAFSDYLGKPVVLNFWATWCGPCQSEMPAFNKLYHEYGDEIQFMMVNLTDGYQDTVEKASEFINKNGYDFPVFYDTEYEASYVYGVSGVPASVFINAKGEVVDAYMGAMSEQMLRAYLENLLEM